MQMGLYKKEEEEEEEAWRGLLLRHETCDARARPEQRKKKKERRGRIFFHWINNGRLNPFRRRQTTYDYISIQLELRTVLYCTTRVSLFFPSFHYQLNQLNHRFLFPPFSFYIGYKINENLCILSDHLHFTGIFLIIKLNRKGNCAAVLVDDRPRRRRPPQDDSR